MAGSYIIIVRTLQGDYKFWRFLRDNDTFVDDTNNELTGNEGEDRDSVAKRMQSLSGKYEKYLRLAGGRLALHKCLWYLIDFKRIGNKIKMIEKEDSPHISLEIEETFSKKTVVIKRLNPIQAHKKLWVLIAPDGNQDKEVNFLHEQVNKWSQLTRTACQMDKDKRMAFNHVHSKKYIPRLKN